MTSRVIDLPLARLDSQAVGISNLGNTSGTTGMASGLPLRFVLVGGNSITLSQSISAGSATITISAGNYLTTADLSQNSSKYAGTSTGMTGGSVTLNTSGIAINLPAYLTTADLSQNSSKYAGINGAITGGSITVNTSGVSVNLPAYLTTAALSGDTSKYVQNWDLTGNTAGTTSSAQGVSLHFSGGNSITISGSSNSIVFSVGNYITTAALSGDTSKYAGINGAITGGSITVNTSGVSVNLPAYLTTAALSADSSKYAGTSTGMTGGSVTLNTSGIAINLPAYLTTAMLSNAATISNIKVSGGTLSNNLSAITFADSNGVSFGLNTDSVLTATVATVSVITLSCVGSSQTFGNVVFSNSNRVSFGLNGSTVTAQHALNFSAGSTSNNISDQLVFSNSRGISFGMDSSTVTLDVPYISYLNIAPFWFNTVTSSFAQSISHMIPFVVPQRISIGSVRLFEVGTVAASSTEALVNGSSLSMSGQTSHNFVFYSRGVGANSQSLQYVTSTQIVDQVSMQVNNAAGANSSQLSYTYRFSLGNTSFTKDYSSTAQSYNFHTSNVTDLTGTKMVDYPCGISLSEGLWYLGYGRSTTFATQNAVISVATRLNISYDSQFAVTQNTLGALGTLGGASSSSVMFGMEGLGSFSTGGAGGTTSSMNRSIISSGASNQVPLLQLIRIV